MDPLIGLGLLQTGTGFLSGLLGGDPAQEAYNRAQANKKLARENLLLQSSDWPFLITTWQAKVYATDRFKEHVERFEKIADMIESGNIDDHALQEIESIDNCFPVIDYRVYQSLEEGVIPQQSAKLAPLYQ